jgi:hypothetical protein
VKLTIAAIAATAALLAQVVVARVFRALHTNVDRFLFADAAMKRRGNIHGVFLTGRSAG